MADSERKTSTASEKMLIITKIDSAIGKIEDIIERSERVDLTDEEKEVLELCINDLENYKNRKEDEWDVKMHTKVEEGDE